MAQDQQPAPRDQSKVVSLNQAILRRRVNEAITAALALWAPIQTDDSRRQMIDLDINVSQIIYGMRRAEIVHCVQDATSGRMSFTAKLLSAGEEFFVFASVQRVAPLNGMHVIIKRVWREVGTSS
jgi:hypothetical protein